MKYPSLYTSPAPVVVVSPGCSSGWTLLPVLRLSPTGSGAGTIGKLAEKVGVEIETFLGGGGRGCMARADPPPPSSGAPGVEDLPTWAPCKHS